MKKTRHRIKNAVRAVRSWVIPYARSRFRQDEFRPILSYLFTDWKCNIDCHYCFDFDNKREGMDLDTAKASIDWLKSKGCRVVAIMGGEPLLRKKFILEVIRYGSNRGMFVYLPTNGYLLDKEFIEKAGEAGLAAWNVAVDTIRPKPGLPKAYSVIEKQLRYLIEMQKKYNYLIFFNINITNKNMEDVRELTRIARKNDIGTDYHICEKPPKEVKLEHFNHRGNDLYITEKDWEKADELLDWLIRKNEQGYTMVNSKSHLKAMKRFMRGEKVKWKCLAGINGSFIRPDGSIAPCFTLQEKGDWGNVFEGEKFDRDRLAEMKKECQDHCLSTCFFNLGRYCMSLKDSLRWAMKHKKS
ncbi:radical SAM protein [Candidatus Woesearchaeota archaeon]|nr:radical SAM protein [Candidatus Woesearchaeota archaeon]